jgi:uncharacterized membrane protein YGL010W
VCLYFHVILMSYFHNVMLIFVFSCYIDVIFSQCYVDKSRHRTAQWVRAAWGRTLSGWTAQSVGVNVSEERRKALARGERR